MSYSNTPVVNCLPTLVIDADGPAAEELAHQLKHRGFTTDIAITCTAAIAAMRACYYGSMAFVGDLSHPAALHCIAELRTRKPRTWIIMISSTAPSDMRELYLRYGVDAVLLTPFSTNDLLSRLLAFSHHSRPPDTQSWTYTSPLGHNRVPDGASARDWNPRNRQHVISQVRDLPG